MRVVTKSEPSNAAGPLDPKFQESRTPSASPSANVTLALLPRAVFATLFVNPQDRLGMGRTSLSVLDTGSLAKSPAADANHALASDLDSGVAVVFGVDGEHAAGSDDAMVDV